jgi:tetratricopeptide (TPR) repeat protein
MRNGEFRWEPEVLAGMTTQAITDKLKELIPAFDLDSFAAKTGEYVSCEDLTEEEYYPHATFSDEDEDFIWMACEELWKRLVPDKLAVELVADQVDNLVIEIIKAGRKQRWQELFRRSREALDLICRHTIEETPSGPMIRRDFYDKLRETTFCDFDSLFDDLIKSLVGHEEYERVIAIAEVFGDATGDDSLLDYKAESLFALGKTGEAEQLYRDIISRNPGNPWCLLHIGDCYVTYGTKDFSKAKDYYLRALSIAEKHRKDPDGKVAMSAVYQRLIDLAHDTGNRAESERYVRLLESLETKETKKVGRNDPCPCGSGKKYKKCCGQDVTGTPSVSFDRRTMEKDLRALKQTIEGKDFGSVDEINRYWEKFNRTGEVPQWVPETPVEKAQSLIYEALETTGNRRLKLIEQALKISPDCADAYVLLAEEKAKSAEEALSLYEAGVRAGERALGKKAFEKEAGHFWGVVETRPYMRARLGLAQCLWTSGKREEAIGHFYELLRLNPNDNQGVRYILAASLLEMGDIDALQQLLGQYDEPTAEWLYTKTLVAFIKQGDSTEARRLFREAHKHNPQVVSYLLGEKKLPKQLPDRVGFGDKSEAVTYAAEFGPGWHQTEGAIAWLTSVSGKARGTSQPGAKPVGIPEVFLQAFESEHGKGRPKKQDGKQKEE